MSQSIMRSSSLPELTLRKKRSSIFYHRVREACTAGTIHIAEEDAMATLSDLFTKPPLPTLQSVFLLRRSVYH